MLFIKHGPINNDLFVCHNNQSDIILFMYLLQQQSTQRNQLDSNQSQDSQSDGRLFPHFTTTTNHTTYYVHPACQRFEDQNDNPGKT